MATINFNTTNSTSLQLLGNGLSYRVPPFQRDYSWTDDEWDDSWDQQKIEARHKQLATIASCKYWIDFILL
jgi:uncharacterized protein with ParB-like and HNH nuclease domain